MATNILARPLDMSECSHDSIHGPDSEPGAVQRCNEETVLIRAQMSPEGSALSKAIEHLTNELLPAFETRVAREALRLALEVGPPATIVMDPADDYGRTKPWDPEGLEDAVSGQ